MGYWGWRRILTFFVSVMVVGCSATYESSSIMPPTSFPPITLIARGLITPTPPSVAYLPPDTPQAAPTALIYVVQPGDTLLGIASQFGVTLDDLQSANGTVNPFTLPIGGTMLIPNPPFTAEGVPRLPTPTPAVLVLLPPACRPSATDGIICLGRILNTRENGVERVNLTLQLLRADGSLLAQSSAGVEQAYIPAGGSAPYRALFKAEWQDYSGASVWLQNAEMGSADHDRYIMLDIQNQQAQHLEGRYLVSATLHNSESENVHLLQAVLTVEDASGQIIGYRVLPLDGALAAGADYPFEISVMAAAPTTHTLYVEAEKIQ